MKRENGLLKKTVLSEYDAEEEVPLIIFFSPGRGHANHNRFISYDFFLRVILY